MSRRLANEAIRDNWDELEIEHFVEDNTIYIPVNDMWTEEENLLTMCILLFNLSISTTSYYI